MKAEPVPASIVVPAVAGIEHDPEVYAAVKRLALATVEAAIDILDTAAPQQQQQMIRIVLPRFTGGLSQKAGDQNEELRGKVTEMFATVAEALDAVNADSDSDADTDDLNDSD
jgi:hypothetical protein